jgi:hypothetical protein
MEPNNTIGRMAHALSSLSVMLLSWFTVLVLCFALFKFRIRSVVSAEVYTLRIILLLDIKEAFTINYRGNIIGAIVLLNNLSKAREFIPFHCEYLFIF